MSAVLQPSQMIDSSFFLGSQSAVDGLINYIKRLPIDGRIRVDVWFQELLKKPQRTPAQNRALHLWLELLAQELNDAGFSLGDGILVRLPVAYTKDNLKENVVKPMLNALWPEKTSTTELNTEQMQDIYRQLDAIISERTGVTVAWPEAR